VRTKNFYSLSLIIAGLLAVASCLGASMPSAKFTNPAKPIMLKPGQRTITIRLQSNPTTGFSWFWVPSATTRLIRPTDHQFTAANNGLMGAPGVAVWHFKISPIAHDAPMVAQIGLVYARPWQLPLPKPVVFTVVTT
jgi:inhibitor of cysteine peptidase